MVVNRLNVSQRIFFGFGLLMALSMAQAGFSVLQFGKVNQQTHQAVGLAGNSQRVLEASHELEAVRRTETHYRLDADDGSLEERQKAVSRVSTLLEDAIRNTVVDTQRATYNELLDGLGQHDESFARLVRQTNIVSAASKKLDEAGTLLSATVAKLVSASQRSADAASREVVSEVERALLVVRVNNWRFQALYDPKGPAAFRKSFERAKAAIAALASLEPDISALQAPLDTVNDAYAASFDTMSAATLAAIDLDEKHLVPEIVAMQRKLDHANSVLGADLATSGQQTLDVSRQSGSLQQVVAVMVLLVGSVLAWVIGRGVTRPITAMTTAMTRLAGGDKSINVPASGRTDEIGGMARAVAVFLRQAIENDRLGTEQAREHAAKERRQRAMDQHTQEFGQSVSGVMASFMAAAETMRSAATDVGESARLTRSSTSTTVDAAAVTARDLNAVAAAAEEMASSIRDIGNQVEQVNAAVQLAVERTSETSAKVNSLSDNADQIGNVVQLINSIAGQTNLLALNATIEAARAGDAGKGFAVVAGEVKALAAQTARATEQIAAQVTSIRGGTRDAVEAVHDVIGAISSVADITGAIAAAMEMQTRATQEIATSVQQVTVTTMTASNEMCSVLAIAERTDECSTAALASAAEVGRTAGTLRSEVNDFLSAMSNGGEEQRRLYERIPGNGARATLRLPGLPPATVVIVDMSRGGVALHYASPLPAVSELEVVLPGGGVVKGRKVRQDAEILGIVFRQDEASLKMIDAALSLIDSAPVAQAA